jgi:hypothetical protein
VSFDQPAQNRLLERPSVNEGLAPSGLDGALAEDEDAA